MRASQLHSGDARAVSASPPTSTRELDADSGPVALCDRAVPLVEVAPEPVSAPLDDAAPEVRSPRSRRRAAAPALVGQPAAAAIAKLRTVGLTPAVELHETQLDGELGVVLAQDPPAEADLARGATLALWVGAPPRETPALAPDLGALDGADRTKAGFGADGTPWTGRDVGRSASQARDVLVAEEVDDDGWFDAHVAEPSSADRPCELHTDARRPDVRRRAASPSFAVADETDEAEDDGWFDAHVLQVVDDRDGVDEPAAIEQHAAASRRSDGVAEAAGRTSREARWGRRLAACGALLVAGLVALAALAGVRHPQPSATGAARAIAAARSAHPRSEARRAARPASGTSPRAASRRRVREPRVPAPPAPGATRPAAPMSSAPQPPVERPSSPAAAAAPAAPPAARAAESPVRREFVAP